MRFRLSPEAEADFAHLLEYISQDSPRAATTVGERVLATAERLVQTPYIGRSGRLPGTRELPVSRTKYVLVYRITQAEVAIVRILHGAQDWPPK